MNVPSPSAQPPHPRPPAARSRRSRLVRGVVGAVFGFALCGFAQAQVPSEVTGGLARLVAADAARLLQAADPVVRGEAALVAAERSSPALHTAVLALCDDDDAAARGRAIVALGLQATPGTVVVLEQLLTEGAARTDADRTAAAFAVGLLPADRAGSLPNRVLSTFLRGNLRREREPLLALLLGISLRDPEPHRAALLQLYDDDSVRDPQVRAQLLHLLLRAGHPFAVRDQRRVLERGDGDERTALLRWFANGDVVTDDPLLATVERLARHGDAAQRTAALAALTRRRHLPALELAARAMRSTDAAECAQGLRSVLAIGGARMRRALERHLLDETNPTRKAALLAHYEAPPSRELLDHAAGLAADHEQPFDVRAAAATLVARAEPERAATLLRDLFRATTRPETLPQLAALLVQDGQAPPLDKLLDGPTDLRQHPLRWQALLAADHPAAVRRLLTTLEGGTDGSDDRGRGLALQLWRRARVLTVPRPIVGEPPASLLAVLGD